MSRIVTFASGMYHPYLHFTVDSTSSSALMLGSVEKALLSVDDDIEQHRDAETIKSALRVLRARVTRMERIMKREREVFYGTDAVDDQGVENSKMIH
jgi:hypothetical protein